MFLPTLVSIGDKERVHALQHLEHFFSPLLSSKEFWAAILGAVLGGFFVVLTQFLSTLWQRKSEQDAERRAVAGILEALAAELKVFKDSALDPTAKQLKELTHRRELAQNREGPKPDPFVKTHIGQNYFSIFELNAGALGRINDRQLREDIIGAYHFAKDLVDRLNATFPEYQIWLASDPEEKKRSTNTLRGFEDGIRASVTALQGDLDKLFPKIEKYLER